MYIIGGKHKKRRLKSPKTATTRPTASQLKGAVFNIVQLDIENANFLDLFAGTGPIGLEALSRGARHVTFVEKDKSSITLLRENIATLKEEENASVLPMDVFKALEKLENEGRVFDIIFADPPYGTKEHSLSNQVVQFLDTAHLLSKEGLLLVEDAIPASYDLELNQLECKSQRKFGRALLRIYKVK